MLWLVEKCINTLIQGIKEKDAFLITISAVCGIFYLAPIVTIIGVICWAISKLGGII